MYLNSPLEQFTVTSLSQNTFSLLGDAVPLTNLGLYTGLTVGLVGGVHLVASNDNALVPSR